MWRLPLYVAIALLSGCSAVQSLMHPAVAQVSAKVAPNPPPTLTVPKGYIATFHWQAVITYVNGAPLTNTPSYKLYNVTNPSLPGFQGYLGNVLTTTHQLNNPGVVCYAVSVEVWDPNGNESAKSTPACATVTP